MKILLIEDDRELAESMRFQLEKEGYETAYSDWLPVPPPQTEVNIGLVSKEKPVIENSFRLCRPCGCGVLKII